MRYLTGRFAVGALRRGKAIEQFLGGFEVLGEPALRWVVISPMNRRYRVSLHTVRVPEDDNFGDLANLLSLDPVDEAYVGEGRELGVRDTENEAVRLAADLAGADPRRWVNDGLAGEECRDFVRARRESPR